MTLRETLERLRKPPPLAGVEETAKMKIILPILRALGWDIHGDEVEYEYLIQPKAEAAKGSARKADVALLSHSGRPVAFIEAKAVEREFTRRDVTQVVRYATDQRAGEVSICVLTNGPVWWLYLPPQQAQQGQPRDRKFAELHLLEDPVEHLEDDLRAFLEKDALVGGKSVKQARRVLKAGVDADRLGAKLPRIWRALTGQSGMGKPDPELERLAIRLVYEKEGLRPTPEQVAEMLSGPSGDEPDEPNSLSPPPDPPLTPGQAAPPGTSSQTPPPIRVALEEPSSDALLPADETKRLDKPTGFILWEDDSTWRTQVDVSFYYEIPIEVVKALHGRHPEIFSERLATLPDSIVSTTKKGLRRPKVAWGTGRYVSTNWNGDVLIEHARRFLEAFDYQRGDLQLIYSSAAAPKQPLGQPSNSRPRTSLLQGGESRITTSPRSEQPPRKPSGFELSGRQYPMNHYYEIPVAVAEAIYRSSPNDFDRVEGLGGKILSKDPGAFRGQRIGETDWYVDTSWKGRRHIDDARRILECCGHDPDDLKLIYERSNT